MTSKDALRVRPAESRSSLSSGPFGGFVNSTPWAAAMAACLMLMLAPVEFGCASQTRANFRDAEYNEVDNSLSPTPMDPDWRADPGGYGDLVWCDREERVRGQVHMSNSSDVPTAKPPVVVCFHDSMIAGIQASESYEFRRGRLTAVGVFFPQADFDAFRSSLEERFGAAFRHVKRTFNSGTALQFDNEFFRWKGPATQVTLKRLADPKGHSSAYFESIVCP